MIRTIIIDDEQHCIDRLQSLLETGYANSVQLLGGFDSVPKGYKAIKELQPELVFLDVQIHDQTGFDLLRETGQRDFEVIFTTAYDKFAVQAFKFSALDYLLKPVDKDDLKLALDKYLGKTKNNKTVNRLDVLLANLKPQNEMTKRIIVPTTTGFEVFETAEILRCESDVNYTTIYLKSRQKFIVAKTLKEFEEMLSEFNFFRVHNSHLINLAYIKSYHKGKGGSVTLSDGTEIEVSTRRKEDFLKRLTEI